MFADFLAASVESLREHGGWLHPAARLVERDSYLSIECDADEGELLLRVPRSAMLPVSGQLEFRHHAAQHRVHW